MSSHRRRAYIAKGFKSYRVKESQILIEEASTPTNRGRKTEKTFSDGTETEADTNFEKYA